MVQKLHGGLGRASNLASIRQIALSTSKPHFFGHPKPSINNLPLPYAPYHKLEH